MCLGKILKSFTQFMLGGWVPLLAGNLNGVGWLHGNEKGEELAVIPGEIHMTKPPAPG